MPQLAELRVLGAFTARSASGEPVDPRAWRTAKTRDLVRLLAVAGRPVPAERIIDVLWPGAEPARGRGSLRTAVSRVRNVLGEDSLVRRGAALELSNVWVDAAAFAARAAVARHRLAEGDVSAGLPVAWEAVALYGGDVCEDESYADWVGEARDRLRRLLRQLLLDAGQGACAVGWWRDAVELGHQALDLDPCAERAYRVLMRAYSGLGETEQALRSFERCRLTLSEQLGADPDDTTRALHLQLLEPQETPVLTASLVGRRPVLAHVSATMAGVVEERRPRAVVLTGPAGSGRSRLLEEAAASWSHRSVALRCRTGDALDPGGVARRLAQALVGERAGSPPAAADLCRLLGDEPVLIVVDDVHWSDADSLAALGQLLELAEQPLLILAAAPEEPPPGGPLHHPSCSTLELPALVREDVAELLTQVLGGSPARSLVEELTDSTRGRPGALLHAVRELLASGQLLSTTDGLKRVSRPSGDLRAPAAVPLLTAARESVGPVGGAVLDLLAVLDRPATLPELCRVGDLDRAGAQLALDQLCDLQPVVRRPTGYALADALVREAAYRRLRPSTSRELHRRVAERAHLPAAIRLEHWLGAGEPALACAAALEAVDQALAAGDDEQLRTHLRTVRAFAERLASDAQEEDLHLCEQLAEVASRLGRWWEAQELAEQARGTRPRLPVALSPSAHSTDHPVPQDSRRRAPAAPERGGRRAGDLPRHPVLAADDAGDVAARVEARIRSARAAQQRRDPDSAARSAKEAMALAEGAQDDALFVRSALALAQTPVLLGDGQRQFELLHRVRDRAGAGRAAGAAGELALTWCLVLHDLDHPDFEQTWRQAAASVRDAPQGELLAPLEVHFWLERGGPQPTGALLERVPEPLDVRTVDDAARVLRARLLVSAGDCDGAVRQLRSVLAVRPSGPSLLAPEAAARLAALLASSDLAAARELLAQARAMTAEHAFPREQTLMLRASAELLRAEGNPSGAATVAMAAAMTARRSGLVRYEADARARHDGLLADADVGSDSGGPLVAEMLPRQPQRPPEHQHR